MIYLIHGQEEYFIREKIRELSDPSVGDIIRLDGSDRDFSIDAMIDACEGNSLFSQRSVVLVNQPFFLIKKTDDRILDRFYRYLQDPLYETDLIFYTYENNFNSKLKAYKKTAENAQVLTFNSYDQKTFSTYARQCISKEQLNISSDAINRLILLCRRDATLFHQNLEVLKLYPERLDADTVEKLCTKSHENDTFDMINALTGNDVSATISAFRKLTVQSDSIVPAMHVLANQLRFLYHIAWLQSQGKRKNEIQEITYANEYRLKMALQTLNNITMEQIVRLLYRLSQLDLKLKSDSSIPENLRFELFLMELIKKGEHEID